MHSKPGIQSEEHVNGGSTRTRILRKLNDPIRDNNGPPGMGGHTLTIRGDTSRANMETLIHIPTGHMRFVPTQNKPEGEAHNLKPSKWPAELALIANAEGKLQFLNIDRVHDILSPAIRGVC